MRDLVPYPPIARHGVIGDRRTAALVASDGTIDWLCLRDYDDDPVFAALIDAERGGAWRMGPARSAFGRQRYVDDTAVLTTSWSDGRGALELTDAMPWPEDERPRHDEPRRVVLRRLSCTRGAVDCVVSIAPRDLLVPDLRFERDDGGLAVRLLGRRELRSLGIWSTLPLSVDRGHAQASAGFVLHAGETAWIVLAADEAPAEWSPQRAQDALDETLRTWRQWVGRFDVHGAHANAMRRSLLTTHLLAYGPSGAMVAAPTLGLPERLGGQRNYDYRYAWIRDASLSASSLSRLGDTDTAGRYLRWLSGLGSRTDSPLQVAYDVHGCTKIGQRRLRRARGYRGSSPVLVGNRAYAQRQIGSLGYVADCMLVALEHGARWRPEYSSLLRRMARHTCDDWREPDSGIWELERHQQFVASKVMCWVVLDRAVRIAERVIGFDPDEVEGWRATAREVRAAVLSRGYGRELGAFRGRCDHDGIDAASLLVPLVGFLPADDARVTSTLDRIEEVLGFEEFLYRFRPSKCVGEKPLPVGEFEGAFLPCTFWMITARAMRGEVDRAEAMLDRIEHAAGELGLLPEEIDPRSGDFLGNHPLLFSHVEHLRSLMAVEEARSAQAGARARRTASPDRWRST